MTRQAAIAIAAALLLATPAAAKEWADALFRGKLSHDFGTVARGAAVEHRFVVENRYLEDVHIQSVRSSCGCTIPRMTKDTLKTWETAELVAEFDTRRFMGQKAATVTVVIDRPYPAEVQVHVRGYIRGDVVFEPGAVQFGAVSQGQSANKRVAITYAGRSDWRIVGVEPGAAFLDCNLAQSGRADDDATRSTLVSYELNVKVNASAPPGYFKQRIMLRTNDPNAATALVPLEVEGFVVAPLTVNPAVVMFNVVPVGQTASKNIVLKGDKPFRLTGCTATDPRFRFFTSDVSRPIQVVIVRFAAGDKSGRFTGKLQLKTDLGDKPVEIDVDALVVADTLADDAPIAPPLADQPSRGPSLTPAPRNSPTPAGQSAPRDAKRPEPATDSANR